MTTPGTNHDPQDLELGLTGFMFFNVDVLRNIFSQLSCTQCGESNLIFNSGEAGKKGFTMHLVLNNLTAVIQSHSRTMLTTMRMHNQYTENNT